MRRCTQYLDGGEADHSRGNALRNSVQLNCGSSYQPQRSLYHQHSFLSMQCWGSVTFWCGSRSGSPDRYLWLMDPDLDPDPTPEPTPFFSDFQDAKKKFFLHILSYNLPASTLSSVFKAKRGRNGSNKPKTYTINVCFLDFNLTTINGLGGSILSIKVKIVVPYSTPLWENGRIRIQKAKTYGSCRSGSPALVFRLKFCLSVLYFLDGHISYIEDGRVLCVGKCWKLTQECCDVSRQNLFHPRLHFTHVCSSQQCCRSGMIIPDLGSECFPYRIPDPNFFYRSSQITDPGSASNSLSILIQTIGFYALGHMIRYVHPGSGSCFLPIPDPGSGFLTLVCRLHLIHPRPLFTPKTADTNGKDDSTYDS